MNQRRWSDAKRPTLGKVATMWGDWIDDQFPWRRAPSGLRVGRSFHESRYYPAPLPRAAHTRLPRWWAHPRSPPVNIGPTIPAEKIEERPEFGGSLQIRRLCVS